MKPEKYHIGDSCLCWSVGDSIQPGYSRRILSAYRQLKKEKNCKGVYDFVPSYNALAIHFDPLTCDLPEIEKRVDELFEQVQDDLSFESGIKGNRIVIPVIYSGEDLKLLSDIHGLGIREIIDIHKEAVYTVAMVGFKPHFPYLMGLDPRIETPRLDSPRLKVPAGAVAIGGAQTGIYPVESPGGWNIIGMTDPEILKQINPGDIIEFIEAEVL